jgi:hypothetical protein
MSRIRIKPSPAGVIDKPFATTRDYPSEGRTSCLFPITARFQAITGTLVSDLDSMCPSGGHHTITNFLTTGARRRIRADARFLLAMWENGKSKSSKKNTLDTSGLFV